MGVTDRYLILWTWFYSGLAILSVCTGFLFARSVMGIHGLQRPSRFAKGNVPWVRIIFVLVLCIVVLFLYIRTLPDIPLLALLRGESTSSLRVLRSQATNAYAHVWRYQLFTNHLLPFLSYVLFAAYWLHRRSRYLAGALLSGGSALFVTGMNLVRSGPVLYLASLFFLYYLTKQRRIPFRSGVIFMLVSAGIILAMIVSIADTTIEHALIGATTRIFGGYIATSYYYLKIFPDHYGFLYGQSFPNPGGLLPFAYFPLTKFVSLFIFGVQDGVVGSAPAPFWAEMYANFGPLGAIIASMLVGVGLWVLHCWTTYWKISPVSCALITYLAFYIRPITTSSLSPLLVPVEPVAVFAVAFFLVLASRRRYAVRKDNITRGVGLAPETTG